MTAALSSPSRLIDGHGRRFEYLRLSLTDRCNFRCSYCLPQGYRKQAAAPADLAPDEISRLIRAFAALGLWKVRLTGGEPSLRLELLEIAKLVATTPGIGQLAMTTNGYRLAARAADYAEAGINALNVSVDSLDPRRFAAITGHNRLAEVLAGVAAARAAGIASIKLNSVLMRGINDGELDRFMAFVAEHDLSLRFIEVMRTNDNAAFFARHHLAGADISERLVALGWARLPREIGAGPAIEYANPAGPGRIGIIAPYARDFCAACNRLRVSAQGMLHLCLFGDAGVNLRDLLQHDHQQDDLIARITMLTAGKAAAHRLHQGNSGGTAHLASIGG
ncbi:MAG: GTP 3',8-cyclase MoaA [Proteobacteria bacterium]|nr:GTP 3',8-cyclase MoaA [Pseudomonadota bacterium]